MGWRQAFYDEMTVMALNYRFLISAFYSNLELLGDNNGSSLSFVLDSRQEYNAMNI